MIILCGGEKGGSAKSTTAINLSGELAYLGYKVGLLDADKKTSAKNWVLTRESLKKYLETGEVSGPLDMEDINDIPKQVMKNLNKNGLKDIEGKNATGEIIFNVARLALLNFNVLISLGTVS